MTDTPELTDDAAVYLIEKRGFYYRPNAQGYTGLKTEAGRYTFLEAAARVFPNGPKGPKDGMSMWHEDEAPEFSSQCPWDAKLRAERDAAIARAEAAEAERDRLREVVALFEYQMSGETSAVKRRFADLRRDARAARNTQEGGE